MDWSHRKLGTLLGSRTAVKIDGHNGRLPDLLFVRADNCDIVRADAIYGAPDMVIEIVSPNDTRSELIALETDYCAIGVGEILFFDPQKRHVRLVRRTEADEYSATTLSTGRLEIHAIPGYWIEVEWLFAETQPDEFEHRSRLLQEAAAGGDGV